MGPRSRRRASALVLVLFLTGQIAWQPREARADQEADFRHVSDWAWFALGAASGFVAHELGHVVTDLIYGKSISFTEVKLGPFPFFAIQPCCNLTHEQEYVIASMGFNVQAVSSELILWLSPHLRSRRRAFLKGLLALDIALSLGYGITALAGIGPAQSDTNTMARGLGIPSWPIGLWLIVPAGADLYRYFVPDSKWAPWVSLQGKAMVLGASFTF
jgi:hypothetical protein